MQFAFVFPIFWYFKKTLLLLNCDFSLTLIYLIFFPTGYDKPKVKKIDFFT